MALPGRLVFTPLGDRWPRAWVTASIFGLQALAVVVLLVSDSPLGVWTFVILFGAGFGAITPARAALMAEFFGPASYGSISGVLSLILSLARALAPVGASVIYAAASGYTAVLGILLIISVGSTLAVLKAGNR
jgi:MFS family permease